MPFEKDRKMSPKKEFVILASQPGANISQLCLRFGVTRATGYKWLGRFRSEGESGLGEKSRRPKSSPLKLDEATERMLLAVRDERPTWGARKIKKHLENLGETGLPSQSTITEVLRRNERLNPEKTVKKWRRFESDEPMDLLQMDFKGHFATKLGRCHPLTIVDDHSRYLLEVGACGNERGVTVKKRLKAVFRRYGLPRTVMTDNSSPWGMPGHPKSLTSLSLWLIRLGIMLKRTGVRHPQTNGKIERMHRTLKAEVVQARQFGSLAECQRAFDEWRGDYNLVRPHEGIGMLRPMERFRISATPFPEKLPEIVYSPGDLIIKVNDNGQICFKGERYRIGRSLANRRVAVREVVDGIFNVIFVRQVVLRINLRDAP